MSREAVARCVCCFCTDEHPCAGGCTWVLCDRFSRIGLCNRCDTPAMRERYEREKVKARATAAFV